MNKLNEEYETMPDLVKNWQIYDLLSFMLNSKHSPSFNQKNQT